MKLFFFLAGILVLAAYSFSVTNPNADAAERKLQHIEQNGALKTPDPTPTELTEAEINAYLASGKLQLPDGVQRLRMQGDAGAVTGTARVDFDQIQKGRSSLNPLLSVFSGIHDVEVRAHGRGAGGKGVVEVDSVLLDGVEIPRFVLELFVEKYIRPKHPEIGLESRFPLPDKIDQATIGAHKLVIVQK